MSEIAVNTITDASGGSTASINGLTPTVSNMAGRNRILNGGMVIDQRNAGAAKTLTAGVVAYVLDRWYVATTAGAGVVQQVAGTGGFTKAMRITGASGVTDGYFGQKIESHNIADAASSTVTYKFRASSSVLTSLTWYARFPTTQDNYAGVTLITSGTIAINSTPTDYSFQIDLPSGVTNGLEVYFTFGAFTSGTLDITGVQLEVGSTATPFERRLYGQELALCQRYFETVGFTAVIASRGIYDNVATYKQEKRASPTLTVVAGSLAGAIISGLPFTTYGGTLAGTGSFRQSSAASTDSDSIITASAEL